MWTILKLLLFLTASQFFFFLLALGICQSRDFMRALLGFLFVLSTHSTRIGCLYTFHMNAKQIKHPLHKWLCFLEIRGSFGFYSSQSCAHFRPLDVRRDPFLHCVTKLCTRFSSHRYLFRFALCDVCARSSVCFLLV